MLALTRTSQKWASALFFGGSLFLSITVGMVAVASHLPFQAAPASLSHIATFAGSGSWKAIHILAAGCACSRTVAEHLLVRGPLPGLQEVVFLIGHDPELEHCLKKTDMAVRLLTPAEAAENYHLSSAPWLVFVGPDGNIRYAGGYSSERNGKDGYYDVQLWNTLRRGAQAAALPAYGCAVARELQKQLDPLGLKYGS